MICVVNHTTHTQNLHAAVDFKWIKILESWVDVDAQTMGNDGSRSLFEFDTTLDVSVVPDFYAWLLYNSIL